MEGILFIGGVVLLVLILRANSQRRRDREEDQKRWEELAARLSTLERVIDKPRPATTNSVAPSLPRAVETQPAELQSPPPLPPPEVQPASPTRIAAENWVTQRQTPSESTRPAAQDQPIPSSPNVVQPPPSASPPEPAFSSIETPPSFANRLTSSHDIEEMLGTNWLNKLGIVILVLGIAFFLAYQLKTLGPFGKILVGFATASALLGAGIWFDRAERYRILARAGVGGGWALFFFTTYAMYHVPAAQVLSSQVTDLLMLLVVAGMMVAHTLRYRSQVVTGLSFLLAFLTVAISHSNVYSLLAGAVLAAALVVIVGRMQWFELEIFGIVASYFNHYLWLRPIIEPMHGKRHAFPEFTASAGMLILYWAIFRVSYILRQPSSERQEHVSSAAALLNTALLLLLFKYQSLHPEWAFWALLVIGGTETLLSQVPITRRRRDAVIVLSTMGVMLLIAAFPFRYSGARLSVLWLIEAEALLLIGVWTREVVFRRLAGLAQIVVSIQMISVDAAMIMGRRMDSADLRPDYRLAVVFTVAAAVFYLNANWLLQRWRDLFNTEIDRRFMHRLGFAAGFMIAVGAWIAFPQSWTAVAWCALGFGLALAGQRLTLPELLYQAYVLGLAAVLRVVIINLDATTTYHGVSVRLLTITLVSVLLYMTSARTMGSDDGTTTSRRGVAFSLNRLAEVYYTWAASFLLALLAWYELRPVGVADAWMVMGLVLLEMGLRKRKLSLRLQGYVAFAASFARIFVVNLNAAGNPGDISPRFYSVVPLGLALYYVYVRLHQNHEFLDGWERVLKIEGVTCWLATITFASLMRFEVPADWVAAAWAALTFGLLAVAWRSGRTLFLHQGLVVTAGVLSRTVLHNFYERSYFPAPTWESRWITVGVSIALLTAQLPLAFSLRRKEDPSTETGLIHLAQLMTRRPEQLIFFVAVGLLTTLLAVEMRRGMVTLSWGLEGVVIFMLALWACERSFRLAGLGILLLCVGKILLVDVWGLNPQDRYLTFIVLGAALLLVSFLYTRNREALRQYL